MKPFLTSASSSHARILSLIFILCFVVSAIFVPVGDTKTASPLPVKADLLSSVLNTSKNLLASLFMFLQGGGGPPAVPGSNLPDLGAARQLQPSDPVALNPIPSTQPCTNCDPCPTCGPGIANHPPIANSGGPYYGTAGTGIVFNGLNSFDLDPVDGISDYAWSFGDNSPVAHGATPTHTYQSAGNYTVNLTVTDRHTSSTSTSTTVNVSPAAAPTPTPTPGQGNVATFVSQSVPTYMTAGNRYPVSVTMRNIGGTTWSAAHLYRLGSQNAQDNATWGMARVYLTQNVAPGADVTFNFTVVAPYNRVEEAPPTANFQWRMVQDGVEWFGDYSQNIIVNIQSNYQPPSPGPADIPERDLFNARIFPGNRTGTAKDDLLSRNFNWSLPLIDLMGRAGLDLNLSLAYNSLVWTRVYKLISPTSYEYFPIFTLDADRGSPSPGFRLGFPTIQGPFGNSQAGRNSYLMITPSGGHVEFRSIEYGSNIYEAVDSSYMQLIEGGNGSLYVRDTDGSQLAYWAINDEYQCTEVKDRNGNFITIKYDPINGVSNLGRITSVIDTLGRVINFSYDSNFRLQSISQVWNGQTHQWVTFGYSDLLIQTNFDGAVVVGVPSNNILSVLSQVGLADGGRYAFEYTSWGQVYRIRHYARDGHQLSYTSYNLPLDNSIAQAECPRFTERRDFVENWNGGSEAITTFTTGYSGSPWSAITMPAPAGEQAITYREYSTLDYQSWRRGLLTKTEIYSGSSLKKATVIDWTQDRIDVPYQVNPRAWATTTTDSEGNRSRSSADFTSFGLPLDIFEFAPYGPSDWVPIRRTHTDYELSEAFVNRRIIGLAKAIYLFAPDAPNSNSLQTLMGKTTYEYDVDTGICTGLCSDYAIEASGSPIVQHDGANYGATFVVGRGMVTRARRWDATDELNINKAIASSMHYNVLGSLIRASDPLGHFTTISYTDAFSNDGISVDSTHSSTMAYLTKITDADGFFSTAKYNYYLGLTNRNEDPKGAAQITIYDTARRVKQITSSVNGAYTRFVYPIDETIVNRFVTINDLQTETYSATVFDGAASVRATAKDFPNSVGHYSGQYTSYDVLGRAVLTTNPTEMTNTWMAAGDDAAGWYSTLQTYDWKGRPRITTNTDGTTKEASYSGCGCAGGQVVTLTDEGTIDAGTVKRRQQKIYSDVLGRTVKTEVLNWQDGSVYSTAKPINMISSLG